MAKKKLDGEITDATAYLNGEYLRPSDFADGPQAFGIAGIGEEEFEANEHEPARRQIVLALETDPPRKLGLNKTNLQTFVDAWGKNPQRWIGRTFEAFLDPAVRNPRGVRTGGVRVRVTGAGVQPAEAIFDGDVPETLPGEKVPF
jgi:hypothetical protein